MPTEIKFQFSEYAGHSNITMANIEKVRNFSSLLLCWSCGIKFQACVIIFQLSDETYTIKLLKQKQMVSTEKFQL